MKLLLIILLSFGFACSQEEERDDQDTPPIEETEEEESKPEEERAIAGMTFEDLPESLAPLDNLNEMIAALNLAKVHGQGHRGQGVKIAVLDNGFTGANHAIGTRLPPDTTLFKGVKNPLQNTTHGTKLAEIAYAVASGKAEYDPAQPGPTMLLINTNGFSNFVAAIDKVIEEKVDIVLYAQVWEYGGNFDGEGFINREVKRAIDAGVLWVNASGNLGQATWNGSVVIDEKKQVKLPFEGQYLRFSVPQDMTPVKIVLAWNDFDLSTSYHTPQDLDLILESEAGKELGAGRLKQIGKPRPGDQTYSAHAREIIRTELDGGIYRLKVQAKSTNFDARAMMRVTVGGLGVRMLENSQEESVLIPADNPEVLAIGALDVEYSGRTTGPRSKPELSVPSLSRFADGMAHQGTSTASAIAVGGLAVLQNLHGKLNYQKIRRLIISGEIVEPDSSPRRFVMPSNGPE